MGQLVWIENETWGVNIWTNVSHYFVHASSDLPVSICGVMHSGDIHTEANCSYKAFRRCKRCANKYHARKAGL